MPIEVSAATRQAVVALLGQARIAEAVAALREASGCSLPAAIEWIEALSASPEHAEWYASQMWLQPARDGLEALLLGGDYSETRQAAALRLKAQLPVGLLDLAWAELRHEYRPPVPPELATQLAQYSAEQRGAATLCARHLYNTATTLACEVYAGTLEAEDFDARLRELAPGFSDQVYKQAYGDSMTAMR